MHGPEHWIGLVRAWVIIAVVVYGFWTVFDVIYEHLKQILHRFRDTY